jgi:hypothetical protein
VVFFAGDGVPPASTFQAHCNTLFIPTSYYYPGFDYFIWDAVKCILMGFQITIKMPFTSHRKISGPEIDANCNMWKSFCDTNLMDVFWVIPKKCVGTSTASAVGNYVIYLEDLQSDFPALRKLVH